MSELVIVSFGDRRRALETFDRLQVLQEQAVTELVGIALVEVDSDGHLHVDTPGRSERRGIRAASSAVFGTVLGALFLMPLAGLAVGGAIGALFASLDRATIDGAFRARVATAVSSGRSAVVVYATAVQDERLRALLDGVHEDDADAADRVVVRTVLTEADERAIVHDFTRLQ